MISKVFVDRPRLAVVIAIVMTIAGIVALRVIPVAQFPDIVPPQVSVTAFFPALRPRWWRRRSPSRSKARSTAWTT